MVPDSFVLGVNARFAPSRHAPMRHAPRSRRSWRGRGRSSSWTSRPAASPNLENETLQAFLAATGVPVRPKQAWTDVATLQANGIPAVNYGPGDPSQAHQPGEWVEGAAVAEVASASPTSSIASLG